MRLTTLHDKQFEIKKGLLPAEKGTLAGSSPLP